ncbi:FAD-dependent oxidoreductase [Alcanivorax sp. IO_7]|nr:FAD-dependent oxidoreductase [Alcanivorax sp. IO_7]
MSQRIAVVGAGISGLTAAWYLSRDHDVTVFEAEPELGGHTYTLDLRREHGDYAVDMGFIVFNDRTYPRFEALLAELGIGRQPTAMGFAVSDAANGLEYCGDGLAGFFGQRRNWVNRRHWRLLADILRFNREAPALLEREEGERPWASTCAPTATARRSSATTSCPWAAPSGPAHWPRWKHSRPVSSCASSSTTACWRCVTGPSGTWCPVARGAMCAPCASAARRASSPARR